MTTIAELAEEIRGLRADLFRANPPVAMNPVEAAEFLGVTTETLFRWRKDKIGPRYSQPTPKFLRYLHEDLVDWMRENR